MKAELLYPEITGMFGEVGHHLLFRKLFREEERRETHLREEPYFVNHDVDFIFLGGSTEKNQEKIIKALLPYRDRVKELIEHDVVFLCTSNAMEVFAEYIETEKGEKIPALGIFPFHAKRMMPNRYNAHFLGSFEGKEIVGFKTQFSHLYGPVEEYSLFQSDIGCGINPEETWEGIRYKNFFGTYLVGPFLILNPFFTKYLLEKWGLQREIPSYQAMEEAYHTRVLEFKDKETYH